jgi:hypothetical protein
MNIPSSQNARTRFIDIYKNSVNRAAIRVPFDNLDSGTRVLSDESECIRYIALYGGHHFHKLYAAYEATMFKNIENQNIQIFDWGCGQALASCVLIDYLIEKNINLNVISITLVEPSQIALKSGCNLLQQIFQDDGSTNSVVRTVNKYIDDLTYTDLVSDNDCIKVHLFSNIMDVEGFDQRQLYQLMVNSFRGVNRIICTSPDNGRQHRLETF